MTGFGRGEAAGEQGTAVVQVSSVNHRQCQVNVRCDLRDLGLDDAIKRTVRQAVQRGAVSVQVQWMPARQGGGIDDEALAEAWRALAALAQELQAPTPTLGDARWYLAAATPDAASDTADGITPLVEQALAEALAAHREACAVEGEATRQHLVQLHQDLVGIRTRMVELAAQRLPAWRGRLQERVDELLTGRTELDEATIAREVAVQADRIDVSEEVERLASHLDQVASLLSGPSSEPVGKQLEFLVQELGREVNTTGAKANDADLTAEVVRAKNVLEQMREQAANIC